MRRRPPAVLLFAFLSSACAIQHPPVGRDFSRAVFSSFVMGQTTSAQARAMLGEPTKSSSMTGLADPQSKVIAPGTRFTLTNDTYLFAPLGVGLPITRYPIKFGMLVFMDDRLVGYDNNSTVPGDSNAVIDEARLADVRQGETTRAEAIAALGPPDGQVLYMVGPLSGTSSIIYSWAAVDGEPGKRRVLRISFDKNGRLATYTAIDNNFPIPNTPPNLMAPQPGGPGLMHPIPPGDFSHT